MKNKKTGFSLVELLVVISIIGIVSVLAVISFSKAQMDGRDRRRIDDLKAIQNAAEQMMLLSGTYPTTVNSYKVTSPSWTVNGQVVLQKFPSDPRSVNGVGITYSTFNIGSASYCVCAQVENTKNSNAENNNCSFANSTGYFCVQNQQ